MQAWERLEKAEHERELALRTELIRQEKLEQLAARFDRKAAMRETWLSENQRLVSQVPQGTPLLPTAPREPTALGGPAPHCHCRDTRGLGVPRPTTINLGVPGGW